MESNDEHGRSDALLKRAARDPDAFTVLVEEVSPALHGYLARRAPGAADDLLAEAWLQAFAARRTFDASRGSARGWLFGVARHVLAGHLRRAGQAVAVAGEAVVDPWQAVDQRLDAAALAPELRRALAGLAGEERELLLLVSWEELTPTEAAAMVGITLHDTGTETARPAGEPSGPVRAESAAVFLERIAQVAHTRPATTDARYWKVRAESSYTGVKPRPAVETYFDRSMDLAVIVTDGRTHRKPGDFSWRLGPGKLESWEALNRLPTDPAKLVALMNSSREYGGQSAFLQAGTLLGSTPARPEVRAALYRAVARLDGVTLTGPVRDGAGRTGTELVFRGAVATDHLVVAPRTGVLLETRSVTTKGSERGKVRRTTYLSSGPADRIG
ncbi:sigma-70 family RNA polymerase sigma factor [Streptomyces tsukubensis]